MCIPCHNIASNVVDGALVEVRKAVYVSFITVCVVSPCDDQRSIDFSLRMYLEDLASEPVVQYPMSTHVRLPQVVVFHEGGRASECNVHPRRPAVAVGSPKLSLFLSESCTFSGQSSLPK